jgi:hypothetical protein
MSLAKAPFHQISLDEGLLQHVCMMARIEIPRGEAELYENNPNCFWPVMFKGARGPLLGMFTARLEKAKEAITDKKDRIGNAYQGIMSNIALLEYQTATIHDIFVKVFMNRDMHLCKENISGFKTFLRSKLQYFKSWYNAMKIRKGRGASLTFISSRTWLNRYTVCGFIAFAKHVLANYNQDICTFQCYFQTQVFLKPYSCTFAVLVAGTPLAILQDLQAVT